MRSVAILPNVTFLYNKMLLTFGNVHNSMKKYIPNDQFSCMLQNHARVKIHSKSDKPVDFNVIQYKRYRHGIPPCN